MLSVFVHQSKNDIAVDRPSIHVDYLCVGKFFNYEVKETAFLLNVYKNVMNNLDDKRKHPPFVRFKEVFEFLYPELIL